MAKRKKPKPPAKRRPTKSAAKAKAPAKRTQGGKPASRMVVQRAMAGAAAIAGCQLMNPAGGSVITMPASINVVFSVGDPANTVGAKAFLCPAAQVPMDPAVVPMGAIDLMKNMMNPSRWTGMLIPNVAGNFVVLAWAFVKVFDCRDSAAVTVNPGP